MKKYLVEGPDGKQYVMTEDGQMTPYTGSGAAAPAAPTPAPTPAAPTAPAAPTTFQRPGWALGSPTLQGAGEAALKGALGVKGLFGGMSREDQARLDAIEADRKNDPESGWRTAGDVGANIALAAIPGGAALKIPQVARLGPALKAAISAAASEGVLNPTRGEGWGEQMRNRAQSTALAGLAGGGTQKVVQGASRLGTGLFKAKPEAERLFKQDVNPTLQQGAATPWGRFVGGLTSGATHVRERQEDEIGQAMLKRITEGNVSLPKHTGNEIVRAGDDYVGNAYNQIYQGKRFDLSPRALSQALQDATALNRSGQFANESAEAGAAVGNIIGAPTANRRVNFDTLSQTHLTPLREARAGASNNEAARRIEAARNSLVTNVVDPKLSPQEIARRGQVHDLNFDLERVKEATSGAAGELPGLPLKKLASAYAQHTSPTNRTGDELVNPALRVLQDHNQDMSRTGLVTANRILGGKLAAGGMGGAAAFAAGGPLAAGAVGGMYGLSALGQTAPGAKFLLGQYDKQKQIAEMIRQYGPMLTGPMTSAVYGE